jgi:hypothetical protein
MNPGNHQAPGPRSRSRFPRRWKQRRLMAVEKPWMPIVDGYRFCGTWFQGMGWKMGLTREQFDMIRYLDKS